MCKLIKVKAYSQISATLGSPIRLMFLSVPTISSFSVITFIPYHLKQMKNGGHKIPRIPQLPKKKFGFTTGRT